MDADFLNTYKPRLVAGRNFSDQINSDVDQSLIINEKAAARMGFKTAEEAIGHTVQKITRDTTLAKIIGVVADYHSQSMHQHVAPLIWQIMPSAPKNTLAIRMEGAIQPILTKMEWVWSNLQLGETFDFVFLEEVMANAYRTELQSG